MTRKLLFFAGAALLGVGSVQAQYYGPANGLGVQYTGRLKVIGFVAGGAPVALVPLGAGGVVAGPSIYAVPSYGLIDRRVIVQPILPRAATVVVPDYDLSGIDLDVETPDRLLPPRAGPAPRPAAKLPMPQLVPPADQKRDVPKKAPAEPPAGQAVPPARPESPVPPAPQPQVDDLLQPRAGAGPESRRLVDLGVLAFKAQQYGLAAWRFQQASVIDPTNARSFFLLAQAYVGVGQFRDAVWAVQEGLRLQPDWPVRDFRPRRDLYGIGKADWLEHVRRVDDAVTRQPDDSAYLFLRAYVAWFDGRRPQAAEWFHQARALVADPRWIDLFLLQAPPPAIANR